MDFGNPNYQDDLEFCLSSGTSSLPYIAYDANGAYCACDSSTAITLGVWHHLAAVLQGYNQSLYLDGNLVGSVACSSSLIPKNVTRTQCMVGRSNWYPNEQDAYADYDELKIYSRALSLAEILADMSLLTY